MAVQLTTEATNEQEHEMKKIIAGTLATLATILLSTAGASAWTTAASAVVGCDGAGTLTVQNNTTQQFIDARPDDGNNETGWAMNVTYNGSTKSAPLNGSAGFGIVAQPGEVVSYSTSWPGASASGQHTVVAVASLEDCSPVTTIDEQPTTTVPVEQPTTTVPEVEESSTTVATPVTPVVDPCQLGGCAPVVEQPTTTVEIYSAPTIPAPSCAHPTDEMVNRGECLAQTGSASETLVLVALGTILTGFSLMLLKSILSMITGGQLFKQ